MITQEQRSKIMAWMDEQRATMTTQQWEISYRSWAIGGNGWDRYGLGGTYITTALIWYQHYHRPGSREWRPPVIMRAIISESGAAA